MRRAVARGRVFPQSYSTDRRYGRLSLKSCALFPLIWVNADDQGRLCGDPEEVKYACCPNIDHITKTDIPQILDELEQNQLIKIYNTPKSAAIQLLDWWDIQKPQWAWPSEYSPPEGWHDRLRYKKGTKSVVTENWLSGESQKGAQVNKEKASGEDESSAQVRPINGSGETQNRIQVSTTGLKNVPRKILAVVGPHPSPPLEYERGIRNSPESQKGTQVRTKNGSGEHQKGTQVAKKPPAPFAEDQKTAFEGLKERRGYNSPQADQKTAFEGLKERRGYNSPQAGAEAKAITWMLKQGYVVEQILGAYDKLKQDEFWRDKLLNMQSVKAQIGEIFRGRRSDEQQESRKGREPPAHKPDPLQAFRDAGGTVILSGEEAEAGDED